MRITPTSVPLQSMASARAPSRPYATVTGVNRTPDSFYGTVWATIGGNKVTLADGANDSWILGGGRYVAWSGADGAGGFENEGQSLYSYDTQTGTSRKVMAEYTMVDKANSQPLSNGKTAFLVKMSDGGLGADHFAVVDPERGEVFKASMAKLIKLQGDRVTIGYFRESDYDLPEAERRPYRTETLDLKGLLTRPVIVNRRDSPDFK